MGGGKERGMSGRERMRDWICLSCEGGREGYGGRERGMSGQERMRDWTSGGREGVGKD